MKKLLPIIILILSIICVMPVTHADPAILVQSYKLYPEVLLPGDSAVLTFSIFNADIAATETQIEGSSTFDMITTVRTLGVKIDEVSIVSDGTGSKKIQATKSFSDVGVIGPTAVIPLSFELTSHKNLTAGLYFPKVRIELDGYDPVLFPIPVRITDVTVDLINTDVPSRLSASGSSEITLTVINHLAGTINNVQIEPMTTSNIAVSPLTTYLGTMAAAMSQDIHFAINPFDIGPASVTFNLSYRNGDNVHHQELTIPFTVIEVLDVAPVISRFPSKIAQGTTERVSVEVYNAKTEEITGVIVTPITDVPISPSQYFIGSMGPDDVFSASFDIDTTNLEQQDYAIAFKVTFKQDNEYYETPVISQSFSLTAPNVAGQEPTLIIPIGIVLIILIIVVFFYIRRRKRRST